MNPSTASWPAAFSVILNPKFEKAIFVGPNKNKGFEFGYVVGLYYRYLKWLSPGIEFYGGIGLIDDSDPLSQQPRSSSATSNRDCHAHARADCDLHANRDTYADGDAHSYPDPDAGRSFSLRGGLEQRSRAQV